MDYEMQTFFSNIEKELHFSVNKGGKKQKLNKIAAKYHIF